MLAYGERHHGKHAVDPSSCLGLIHHRQQSILYTYSSLFLSTADIFVSSDSMEYHHPCRRPYKDHQMRGTGCRVSYRTCRLLLRSLQRPETVRKICRIADAKRPSVSAKRRPTHVPHHESGENFTRIFRRSEFTCSKVECQSCDLKKICVIEVMDATSCYCATVIKDWSTANQFWQSLCQ